ncbi:cysteine proteinase inhibitor 1 [Punica granatum]|uniref:Uncharacterized protein n=2 Tax=Punica granatum TaxID=22663 RepID=A0A2I0KD08_PUNGR|nr:cysteine proteinase inhibitor 1 [Punica granatum]PKI66414.1 hypothetical protein CRG98_013216 [Punica granatum]
MGARSLHRRSFIPLLLLLLAASVVPLLSAAGFGGGGGPVLGGWKPIKDVNDPYIKEIAGFAVSEHNKQARASLKLQGVKSGESQVVAGTNYRLIIAAADGAATGDYEAVVWDKPWERSRKLTTFKPVTH